MNAGSERQHDGGGAPAARVARDPPHALEKPGSLPHKAKGNLCLSLYRLTLI
jgi:hypothetical protein